MQMMLQPAKARLFTNMSIRDCAMSDKLKKLVADLSLDRAMLQDVIRRKL